MPADAEQPRAPRELPARHMAFWRRDRVGAPLLMEGGAQPHWTSVRAVYPSFCGRELAPAEADADRFVAALDWPRLWRPGDGDLLAVAAPNPRIPWLEAIAGARVCPQLESDSIWAGEPRLPVAGQCEVRPDEAWTDALLRHLSRLRELVPPWLPVCPTLMRGPGDVLEALLGSRTLMLALADEADWLGPLIESVTGLFVRVARAQWGLIEPWCDGYVNFFGFWSPEPCVRVQEDVQRVLSAAAFRRWLRPALERIVASFPFSIFHMHSGSLHVAEEVATVPGLDAVQVSVDPAPYAPPLTESLDVLRAVQQRVSLFIEGPMTDHQLAALLRGLDPAGLAVRREKP
jgi:hypothetical protein